MTTKTVKERARKPKAINAAQGLIDALKFVLPATKKSEHLFQKYVVIDNKTLIANDGVLSIGALIEEDITACPRADMLLAALNKCGEKFSLTVEDSQLCVVSGEYTAYIPCLPLDQMPITFKSEQSVTANESLKKGFLAVMDLAKEGSPHVMTASLWLRSNSVTAANSTMIKEYWHGLNLPAWAIVPKLAAQCVAKSNKTLIGLGGSKDSITFWFSDRSFICAQTFADGWADVDSVLNQPTNAMPLPDDFWKALETVLSFGESEKVCFDKVGMSSESGKAIFELDGVNYGAKFDGKLLKASKEYIRRIDCQTHRNKLYFFGENLRGVLGGEPI
ncbi:putative DNA polymerase III, beta subunit [Acinetobacter phage Loki]|uniref:Putative DNA polymerase III, beta subunit n=1 Tax=Acinetobacter phage Loki TaxID=1970374 RepID=A0A0P1KWG1_9CAUD|nr:putative DNA polymerase III, beta subunit [Acinetobacter phage Loki]CUS06484.1 putative DNA polymerase III, beta subunit [Acinetobacter phage Loki]